MWKFNPGGKTERAKTRSVFSSNGSTADRLGGRRHGGCRSRVGCGTDNGIHGRTVNFNSGSDHSGHSAGDYSTGNDNAGNGRANPRYCSPDAGNGDAGNDSEYHHDADSADHA